MESMFNIRPNNYSFTNVQELVTEQKRAIKNGLETNSYRADSIMVTFLPKEIKSLTSLDIFKSYKGLDM